MRQLNSDHYFVILSITNLYSFYIPIFSIYLFLFFFFFIIIFQLFMIPLFTIILLIYTTNQSSYFKQTFIQNPKAKCLDGSKPTYYFSKGTGKNSSNYIVGFQSEIGCGVNGSIKATLQQCYKMSFTNNGSTIGDESSYIRDKLGLFSGDPSFNPYYYDWNRVIIRYCDATFHQGSRKNPVLYKGRKLYFRGYDNIVGAFQTLQKHSKMLTKGKNIVLTGFSGGGAAVFSWCTYLTNITKGNVWCVADSGISFEMKDSQYQGYRKWYGDVSILQKIVNVNFGTTLPECDKKYPNQLWKCYAFPQTMAPFIKGRIFVLQSLYDTHLIQLLKIKCVNYFAPNFTTCTPYQRKTLQQLRVNITKILQIYAAKQGNGIWGIACPNHGFIYYNAIFHKNWRVPAKSENSVQSVINKWIFSNQKKAIKLIDDVTWPQNKGCSNHSIIESLHEQI